MTDLVAINRGTRRMQKESEVSNLLFSLESFAVGSTGKWDTGLWSREMKWDWVDMGDLVMFGALLFLLLIQSRKLNTLFDLFSFFFLFFFSSVFRVRDIFVRHSLTFTRSSEDVLSLQVSAKNRSNLAAEKKVMAFIILGQSCSATRFNQLDCRWNGLNSLRWIHTGKQWILCIVARVRSKYSLQRERERERGRGQGKKDKYKVHKLFV